MSTRLSLFLSAAIIGAIGAFAALMYPRLSSAVPMHWDINGKIDSWLPKSTAVGTMIGLMVGVLILFQVMPLLSPKNFRVDGFLPTYNVIRVVVLGLVGYVNIVALLTAMELAFDPARALIGGLMLFLAVVGNYLGKVRKNLWIGIRVPWTLASDKNWIATHRMAAWLLVATGILGATAAFAGAPLAILSYFLVGALILPVFYSLWLSRTGRDRDNGPAVAIIAMLMLTATAHGAEREVTFKGVGGLELKGTLTVPDKAEKGKTRALLLIPGSGPSDRNGNQPPAVMTDVLKQIAGRLEQEGIATLRFDKRALLSYAKFFPKDMKGIDEYFAFENFVGDAEAALDFLRAQPEIDPTKAGVLGHSEGGTITLKLTQTKNPPPFIVLMACPGRPVGDALYNQLEDGMIRKGIDSTQRATDLKELRRVLDEFKSTHKIPTSIPDQFKLYFPPYAPLFMHTFYFFEPIPVASAFAGPVLLLQGEKDIQILAGKDAAALRKGFANNPGFTYQEFPSLSHNFKLVKDENKEDGFGGPVPPEVLTAIVDWMRKR